MKIFIMNRYISKSYTRSKNTICIYRAGAAVVSTSTSVLIERFSFDLEMKTREQNRNNKQQRKKSDLIGLSNGYKREWLLVG